jgi:hypothetical protein
MNILKAYVPRLLVLSLAFFVASQTQAGGEKTTTQPKEAGAADVLAAAGRLVNQIPPLFKLITEVPGQVGNIKAAADALNPLLKCLPKEGGEECVVVGCRNKKACIASTLVGFVNLLKPITDTFIGQATIGADGKTIVQPKLLVQALTILNQIPGLASPLIAKLPESVRTKVDAIAGKFQALTTDTPQQQSPITALILTLDTIYSFLTGLELMLDPEGAAQRISKATPLPLPPVQVIEEKPAAEEFAGLDLGI